MCLWKWLFNHILYQDTFLLHPQSSNDVFTSLWLKLPLIMSRRAFQFSLFPVSFKSTLVFISSHASLQLTHINCLRISTHTHSQTRLSFTCTCASLSYPPFLTFPLLSIPSHGLFNLSSLLEVWNPIIFLNPIYRLLA